MVTLGRFELPTCGLGNRRSIHLSYRATSSYLVRNGFRKPSVYFCSSPLRAWPPELQGHILVCCSQRFQETVGLLLLFALAGVAT
jgi:hypothetical protein